MQPFEKARQVHAEGFNCSQSVLCGLSEYTGIDDDEAKALGGCFGGGIGAGETCGAVIGAAMALGLAFPYNDSSDGESCARAKRLGRELCMEFNKEYGALSCRALLSSTAPLRRCS